MNHTTRACLFAFLVFFFSGVNLHAADQPKPGPEHKKLERGLGVWKYEGEAKASPFGPAGKFHGTTTVRLILNGFFTETRWEDKNDVGYVAQGVVITGYDAAKKTYVAQGFENDGSITPGTSTIDGDTWTTVGTRTDGAGKVYKMKMSGVYAADGKSATEKAEYSSDDGHTWQVFYELANKRVRK